MSQTTAPATLAEFKVPNHRSLESSGNGAIAPIRLAALVPVSDSAQADESPSEPVSRRLSVSTHRTAAVIGITALTSGTAMLVVAALFAR